MNYVIVNTDELDDVDFAQVLEASPASLRYSLDGTLTLVKYEGSSVPSSLGGKTQYDYSEIMSVLSGDAWTSEPPS